MNIKGCAIVKLASSESAHMVIRTCNDIVMMGRPILVCDDREGTTMKIPSSHSTSTTTTINPSSSSLQLKVVGFMWEI
jgi:hypothetical protein